MLVIELVKSTGLAEIDLGLLAMGDAMHDVGGPLSGLEFHFVRGLRYEWIGCRPTIPCKRQKLKREINARNPGEFSNQGVLVAVHPLSPEDSTAMAALRSAVQP